MLLKIIILTLLVLTARPLCAETPSELHGFDIVKLWQFDASSEGWKPDHNVSPFTINNGTISFRNTGFDPWIIYSPSEEIDVSRARAAERRARERLSRHGEDIDVARAQAALQRALNRLRAAEEARE